MRVTTARLAMTVVAIGILTGCGRYYYNKPGAPAEQFSEDSQACAREITAAVKASGSDSQRLYRLCLHGRGWVRDKQREPVPEGWYRGIE
jgi:hypothetical protein